MGHAICWPLPNLLSQCSWYLKRLHLLEILSSQKFHHLWWPPLVQGGKRKKKKKRQGKEWKAEHIGKVDQILHQTPCASQAMVVNCLIIINQRQHSRMKHRILSSQPSLSKQRFHTFYENELLSTSWKPWCNSGGRIWRSWWVGFLMAESLINVPGRWAKNQWTLAADCPRCVYGVTDCSSG